MLFTNGLLNLFCLRYPKSGCWRRHSASKPDLPVAHVTSPEFMRYQHQRTSWKWNSPQTSLSFQGHRKNVGGVDHHIKLNKC